MKYYFYSNTKNDEKKDVYLVYGIEARNDDIDIVERKCKTIARKLNDKLAGGWFTEKYKPFNFENYIVVNVPYSTRTSLYTKQDKFIIGLIEAEANMEYELI